jgi:predicted DNA-binding antitoxin AbrB/MazE fold protein
LGGHVVTITVEATYEDGVLKPTQPLPLKERERVTVRIDADVSRARRTAGLMQWTGSTEAADFIATSPELDPQESA